MRAVIAAAFLGVALFAGPAVAQQMDIQIVPPDRAREPFIITPRDQYDAGRPHDYDDYPRGPRVRHDPAFIGPLSAKAQTPTATGRFGVAGWTAPNTPVSSQVSGWQEVTGWFALGFAVEWGGPPPAKRAPAAAPVTNR
jgi:hypothetical protein